MDKKYRIELSENQFQIYMEALESYSRFLSGQIGDICHSVTARKGIPNVQDYINDPVSSSGISILKGYLFPELGPGSSHGIGTQDTLQGPRQISYEMYREARHFLAKRDVPSANVYASEGLKYSSEPTPKYVEIGIDEIRLEKINQIESDESLSLGN